MHLFEGERAPIKIHAHINIFFQLAHVEDSKNFPGGKNYQTTINDNEMKQIFSYIPKESWKYQEMLRKRLIFGAPSDQQPPTEMQENEQGEPGPNSKKAKMDNEIKTMERHLRSLLRNAI